MSSFLSSGEKQFITQGAELGVRNDGRGLLDYRQFTVETGVMQNANGSARVKLGSTEVLVCVKAEITPPESKKPKEGKVQVSVECTAIASPEFEGRSVDKLNVQLTAECDRLLRESKAVDVEKLCLVPGKQCWTLYIDALVLDTSGNLLDAISIGCHAALRTTTLPAIQIVEGENGEKEIEVSDDAYEAKPLPLNDVPIFISFARIGSQYVVDATSEEEACMSSRLTFAVNSKSALCGMQKSGTGSIPTNRLYEMMRHARKLGCDLIKRLTISKNAEKDNDSDEEKVLENDREEEEDETKESQHKNVSMHIDQQEQSSSSSSSSLMSDSSPKTLTKS
eukprot:TRINITY_DN7679_c0_g1_i1.p1 TRINITY_DN7679_c0_g1~~TRINITY_DN7679_c0_g1_i1.p1  ORF type:complete len:337 (+),score=93.48 TRINITY_DN7679_c0_g1_i1:91-1101(+)